MLGKREKKLTKALRRRVGGFLQLGIGNLELGMEKSLTVKNFFVKSVTKSEIKRISCRKQIGG